MRIRNEQVTDLEALFKNVIVDVDINGNIATLNRVGSTVLSFEMPEEDYSLLFQGDKGQQGQRGDSAYQVYKRDGGTLSETVWLQSLKGAQGERGEQGDDGIDGIDGIDAVNPIIDKVMISKDISLGRPAAKLLRRDSNKYNMVIKIPEGQKGERGRSLPDEQIIIRSVEVADKGIPFAKAENIDYKTYIDFKLIRGSKGEQGDPADLAMNGIVPDIKLKINMISEDKVPVVRSKIDNDIWNIIFDIPKGKQGDSGEQGKKGIRADLMPDVHYASINESEAFICAPSVNSFKPFSFILNGKRFFGWSVNSLQEKDYDYGRITQCAFAEDGSDLLIRTKDNGNVFGSVAEGWISSYDISHMKG